MKEWSYLDIGGFLFGIARPFLYQWRLCDRDILPGGRNRNTGGPISGATYATADPASAGASASAGRAYAARLTDNAELCRNVLVYFTVNGTRYLVLFKPRNNKKKNNWSEQKETFDR